jgi:hypothetical protein
MSSAPIEKKKGKRPGAPEGTKGKVSKPASKKKR